MDTHGTLGWRRKRRMKRKIKLEDTSLVIIDMTCRDSAGGL